jgi:hypothetical protein
VTIFWVKSSIILLAQIFFFNILNRRFQGPESEREEGGEEGNSKRVVYYLTAA